MRRRTGVLVPIDAFDLSKLPAHLRVTFAVETADGTEVARGKDLAGLQERLAAPVQRAVAEAVAGELAADRVCAAGPTISTNCRAPSSSTSGGHTVRGFPAFVDTGTAVDLRVFATAGRAGPRDAARHSADCCG